MSANNRQVAGNHYQNDVQHWDIVAMYNLDYYTGTATKYLLRFGKKGESLQDHMNDLDKAKHYIEKRMEILRAQMDEAEREEEERETYYVNVERGI